MHNPCQVTAECLERLLAFYEGHVEEDERDTQLTQTARACISEMLRPCTVEETAALFAYMDNARRRAFNERATRVN